MYFYNFIEDLSLNFIQISPLILMIAILPTFFFDYARGGHDNILNFDVLSVELDDSIM